MFLTMKDNKLLAEYLGLPIKNERLEGDAIDAPARKHSNILRNWQPNKDWNQLMMVVEKIEGKAEVEINGRECTIDWGILLDPNCIGGEEFDTKIEAVYNACVEYIKQCF
jgi:hypothetical protein